MLGDSKNEARIVKVDDWVWSLIVDPLSKEPLTGSEGQNYLLSPYGRKYQIVNGVLDLRLLNNRTTRDQKAWSNAQNLYESLSNKLKHLDQKIDYFAECKNMEEVYQEIPILGCCLDAGGHDGRLRRFLSGEQKYISCDPFLRVFNDIDKCENLIKAYPFILDPFNFICCYAEFLPFKSTCFQTVHMRSVVDHFLNPELALNEAYRVLDTDGQLIVGSYVYGGRTGKPGINRHIRKRFKSIISSLGIYQFNDHV